MHELNHDLTCVPYEKRYRYYAQTFLLMLVTGVVFVYLLTINPILSLLMLAFYLGSSYFQAYCCAYQECPYIGQFCPAIFGIYPANIFARRIMKKGITKSKSTFEWHATVALLSWLGVVFVPLYWLWLLNPLYAIGYFAFHLISFVFFMLTICPTCAIRDTCPGGGLQKRLA